MIEKRNPIFMTFCMLMLFWAAAFSSAAYGADVAGSKDHPLISRFPGSTIVYHEQVDFGEYVLALGGLDDERNLSESRSVAGQVTRIQYSAPEDRSTYEVYHNYASALKEAGFEILFSGTSQELSWRWTYVLYESEGGVNPLPPDVLEKNLLMSEDDFRYLSGELSRAGDGNVYVALTVSQTQPADGPGIQLDIVEEKSMEKDKITIDADTMASEIDRSGAVSIQEIYFDTGKARLKDESEAALAEIAKFINQASGASFYVIGHTDSRGELDYNMDLSESRAESVVEALATNYNVDANRLTPKGVGPLAPIATNDTQEGRAQNRRVAIVKK
ncbi:MAG: OmpA family protein [Desulfobacteraceae bacterium]|nr:OmpA family protein [Desulfobacteraceae bacterium]